MVREEEGQEFAFGASLWILNKPFETLPGHGSAWV